MTSPLANEIQGGKVARSSKPINEVRDRPRGSSARVSDVRSERDTMIDRLRSVGATGDEVDGFLEAFDGDDDDGWIIPRSELVSVSDRSLRRMLVAARREHAFHTDPDAPDPELLAAWEHAGGSKMAIADVAAWVGAGDDPVARALLVASQEPSIDDGGRKGIHDLVASVTASAD